MVDPPEIWGIELVAEKTPCFGYGQRNELLA